MAMQKIRVRGELIIGITTKDGPDVIEAELPKGVGLERLRWNGSYIVDLGNETGCYVYYHEENDTFKFFVNPVLGAEWVDFTWDQRDRLAVGEDNVIFVRKKAEADLDRLTEKAKSIERGVTSSKMQLLNSILISLVIVRQYSENQTYKNKIDNLLNTHTSLLEDLLARHSDRLEKAINNFLPMMKVLLSSWGDQQEIVDDFVVVDDEDYVPPNDWGNDVPIVDDGGSEPEPEPGDN